MLESLDSTKRDECKTKNATYMLKDYIGWIHPDWDKSINIIVAIRYINDSPESTFEDCANFLQLWKDGKVCIPKHVAMKPDDKGLEYNG